MAAATEASSCDGGGGGGSPIRLNCSHGGRLLPRGPGGALRYVGGETRVLVVPRAATFRDLAARLSSEMAGGAEVRAIGHRLADEGLEDVVVSVTSDEELAHMRDEYDRLRAARPAARFRVFVTTTSPAGSASGGGNRGRSPASGLPPLAPRMRRVQSEQAQLHWRPTLPLPPVRRVQSAQEFAGRLHVPPSIHRRRRRQQQQGFCSCQSRDLCAPAPSPAPARPMYAAVAYMSKKVAAAPSMPAAMATGRVAFGDAAMEKTRCRDFQAAAMETRRAIWEFE